MKSSRSDCDKKSNNNKKQKVILVTNIQELKTTRDLEQFLESLPDDNNRKLKRFRFFQLYLEESVKEIVTKEILEEKNNTIPSNIK